MRGVCEHRLKDLAALWRKGNDVSKHRPHRRTGNPVGRPHKSLTGDPDLLVIGDALVLMQRLSKRIAIDLALSIHEGQAAEPTKRPRGRRPPNWLPGGLMLRRPGASFCSRNSTIRKKMKRLPRRVLRVLYLTALLRMSKH
jgi:hypothetical protein